MLTAIRKKLGLKVSLTLALVMLVLTAVVATYITFDQTATLEQSVLKKAQLAASLGAQSYGAVLEQAADNGLLTISDVFDTNYQVVPGWDWGQNPKYHTKYDVVTDNATIVVLDKFLDDKDFIYAIGADRNGYVPTHNSIFNQPLTGNGVTSGVIVPADSQTLSGTCGGPGHEQVVEAWLPFRTVFDHVWNGHRHVIMAASQIDRYGNQNFACIGEHAKPKAQLLGTPGEAYWGGAASTAFFVNPEEDLALVFLTQLLPSSSYPVRRELRIATYQAIED